MTEETLAVAEQSRAAVGKMLAMGRDATRDLGVAGERSVVAGELSRQAKMVPWLKSIVRTAGDVVGDDALTGQGSGSSEGIGVALEERGATTGGVRHRKLTNQRRRAER